jgi:hypothetical protein
LREQIVRLVDESDPPTSEVVLDAEGMVDMDITTPRRAQLLDGLNERGVRLMLASSRRSSRCGSS